MIAMFYVWQAVIFNVAINLGPFFIVCFGLSAAWLVWFFVKTSLRKEDLDE